MTKIGKVLFNSGLWKAWKTLAARRVSHPYAQTLRLLVNAPQPSKDRLFWFLSSTNNTCDLGAGF